MKIQPPTQETQKKPSNPVKAILILLILAGAVAGFVAWNIYTVNNVPSPAPTAVITFLSFTGDVSTSEDGAQWKKPSYGDILKPNHFLQNGKDAETDLKYGETAFVRLKKNSSIQYVSPSRFTPEISGRLHLENGTLLIASGKETLQASVLGKAKQSLKGDTSTRFINISPETLLLIRTSSETNLTVVSVLRGLVTLKSEAPAFSLEISDTEMAEIPLTGEAKKTRISQEFWKDAREAYELKPKTAATEAAQMDIAKKAGNFFDYVLDHGTFYQQKWGWCEREFVEPEDKTPAYLETTYDVFPRGSWVGVYLKTRNLDLSKFKAFKIEARRIPGRPHPQFVRLEFKSKAQVLQAFAIKMLNAGWENIEFPIRLSKESMISELTIIFTHEKVGSDKSGGFQIRNFTLIPLDPEDMKARSDREAASSKMPVTVGVNESAITKIRQLTPQPAAPKKESVPEPVVDDIQESKDLSDF